MGLLGCNPVGTRIKHRCAIGLVLCLAAVFTWIGCDIGFNPTGFTSPPQSANVRPELTVLEPNEDLAISQGESFIIRWTDSDPDSNALIDIDLVETDGPNIFQVAGGLREDDVTEDLFVVETEDIVQGNYFVRMTINDEVNSPLSVFAEVENTGNRVQVTITPRGLGTQNTPPRVFVAEPHFNLGVSQNDILTIIFRPRVEIPQVPDPPASFLYDPEGNAVDVTVLLDLNDNPLDDDSTSDDDPGNIILRRLTIEAGRFDPVTITEEIDVQEVPVRNNGLPYFIRVTLSDGLNTVNSYAGGKLHVLELVEGSASSAASQVDLGQIGRTLSGSRFYGFNPFANLGSKVESAKDQDLDGIGDVVMIAQYGNPYNFGNIGEAYLVYGLPGQRFGGEIAINSVAPDVPDTSFNRVRGVVFTPHVEVTLETFTVIDIGDDFKTWETNPPFDLTQPYTWGITDVVAVNNLGTGGAPEGTEECQVPELFFGMPHNEYLVTSRDDDEADEDDQPFYCYPDNLSNNYTNDPEEDDPTVFFNGFGWDGFLVHEEKMGTAALFYGENNLTGFTDDGDGNPCDNLIAPAEDKPGLGACGTQGGGDGEKSITGARFNVAIFDYLSNNLGGASGLPFPVDPLNSHYGMNVATLPDLDLNSFDELVISAPRNEIESSDLLAFPGANHPHLATRLSPGNVIVFLGQDFNNVVNDQDTTTHIPFISTRPDTPGCDPPFPRFLETNYAGGGVGNPNVEPDPGYFYIRGWDPFDKLGGATGAGDFNLDGPTDIMAGAPYYDPKLDNDGNGIPDGQRTTDAGAVYIVYLRWPFGDTELASAEFPDNEFPRAPMLRIFGETRLDHLGLRQEGAGDVNQDGIDDVVIASKDYNSNGLVDNGFVGVVFGGQRIDGDRTVSQIATSELNGVRFFGNNDADFAGADIASSGDFNGDGAADILISAPNEEVGLEDSGEDKLRRGVVYLIFGGRHLENETFMLDQVGTEQLPGIVFLGPYQEDTPDAFELEQKTIVIDDDCNPYDPDDQRSTALVDSECLCDPIVQEDCTFLDNPVTGIVDRRTRQDAAPEKVGFVGDLNGDGFDDIMIGNPTADFFDPQQPGTGRRADTGEVYLVYGNNFGANSLSADLSE